ncbi:protein Star-like isoform X2 [Panulirus ornatus]|uniref:protein Star-like isoform X2 n=1 Tax=Panulirus ornatus TaxID=150431 RepID=UPI003A8AE4F7
MVLRKLSKMPVKIITPNRAGFVIGTAACVMIFNSMFLLPAYEDTCENYHLERILKGPITQDDPILLQWLRGQMVPPSRLPYNLSYFLSGLHQDIDLHNSTSYSPSQEFILSQVEKIYGDKILQPGTFLEAGAYDGEFLSNTLYLEHEFGWRGILVEANPTFFQQMLLKRRKSWSINVCLNTKPYPTQEKFMMGSASPVGSNHLYNGQGEVNPLLEKHISLGSSGLVEFKDNNTQEGSFTVVQCVPLYSVLTAMELSHVDFLSLDVEHAEMGILDTIPWDKLSFTCRWCPQRGDSRRLVHVPSRKQSLRPITYCPYLDNVFW